MSYFPKKDPTRIYWIKIKALFFETEKMRRLKEMPDGILLQFFWIRLLLLCIEKVQDLHDIGVLRFTEETPYDVDSLSSSCGLNRQTVETGLKAFLKLELISISPDGTIIVPPVQELIASEGSSAERMRGMRAKATRKAIGVTVEKIEPEVIFPIDEKHFDKPVGLRLKALRDNLMEDLPDI